MYEHVSQKCWNPGGIHKLQSFCQSHMEQRRTDFEEVADAKQVSLEGWPSGANRSQVRFVEYLV